ncbi:DUF424 family protein [Candidatus Woesearchaeota archaeon]|nr:DUF424 family protein [Candidatus Woesearchaeota archaeon]
MILVKIHKAEKRKIISICDDNLVGKKFEDEDLQLDVSKYFYKGEKMKYEDVMKEIKGADSLNIVGEESIRFALKNNLIEEESIIRIKKIPHAISLLR